MHLDEGETPLDAIEGETLRTIRLVDDLLLLARADAGQLPLDRTPVELDTLLLEVYNQARVLAQDEIEVDLRLEDRALVIGDPDRLRQLLLNLVSNALKHTDPGGQIRLGLHIVSNGVRQAHLTVSDTGVGISPEHLPHIFDRFYRVDEARARQYDGANGAVQTQGAGLGLSIAKWIAEAHGGEIQVDSVVGEGSTFTLRLPLADG